MVKKYLNISKLPSSLVSKLAKSTNSCPDWLILPCSLAKYSSLLNGSRLQKPDPGGAKGTMRPSRPDLKRPWDNITPCSVTIGTIWTSVSMIVDNQQ